MSFGQAQDSRGGGAVTRSDRGPKKRAATRLHLRDPAPPVFLSRRSAPIVCLLGDLIAGDFETLRDVDAWIYSAELPARMVG